MHRRAFLAATTAALAAPAAVRAGMAAGWRALAPAPWAVQEIYCALWRGGILMAGGLVGRGGGQLHIEDRAALYSVAEDRWSEVARLPQARHHPMLVAQGDAVWALGGYGRSPAGDWTAMTEVWRFDGEGWTPDAAMPQPQCETTGVSIGDRIHLITGRAPAGAANGQWNDQADIALHQVFMPADGRWETARPCPMARNSAAAAVLDGAIFVAGGRTVGGGGTGRLDRYDPVADRWDRLAPIPRSYAANNQTGGGLAMAAAGGRLVAFGGEWFQRGGGGGVFAETWIYDPAADRWAAGPDMLTPRHGLGAVAVGETVYAVAGGAIVSGGGPTARLEALTPGQVWSDGV